MNDKTLKDKAILIKGKKYVLVADRVVFFNDNFPNGSIQTKLITQPLDQTIVIQAVITPDHEKSSRYFTGFSQAVIGDGYINKTSALENAETSAVGRALALMGIGVIDSIASVDEIKKTTYTQYPKYVPKQKLTPDEKANFGPRKAVNTPALPEKEIPFY